MIELGVLKCGKASGASTAVFSLEQHEEGVHYASENSGWRSYTVVTPNGNSVAEWDA